MTMAIAIVFLVLGLLLLLGPVRVVHATAVLGGLIGAVLCTIGAGILWGPGGALVALGFGLGFWGAAVRDYGIDAPMFVHSYPAFFAVLTGLVPWLLVICGIVLLVLGIR